MITLSAGTLVILLIAAFLFGAISIPLIVYLFLKLPTRLYRVPAPKPQVKEKLAASRARS